MKGFERRQKTFICFYGNFNQHMLLGSTNINNIPVDICFLLIFYDQTRHTETLIFICDLYKIFQMSFDRKEKKKTLAKSRLSIVSCENLSSFFLHNTDILCQLSGFQIMKFLRKLWRKKYALENTETERKMIGNKIRQGNRQIRLSNISVRDRILR